jgi:HK97 family phage portal protein
MRFLGRELTFKKAFESVSSRGGWWPIVHEPFAGAWQRNIERRVEDVLACSTVYTCISLIAGDIGKMRLRLVQQDKNGIWTETESSAFSPVLKKPNRYQTRQQFIENWMVSKLSRGNTYVLKQRDQRGVVVALYILDPCTVKPMVADDGSVWYQLSKDNLSNVPTAIPYVPASEIIHDRMKALYHPLCGVSPLHACGLSAAQAIKIQEGSESFFANGAMPGGILVAPGKISELTVKSLKDQWDNNYSGQNRGKVAVLGDNLRYERMTLTAHDAQLIEQLKWTAENVAACFMVPGYMVGAGDPPSYNNIEALNQQYYSQCLQTHIEAIEALLDEGLPLPKKYGCEFNLDDLLRMDTATLVRSEAEAVKAGIKAPNEARARLNLGPAKGGNSPMMQQQNFSLEALAERPTASATPPPPAPPGGSVQATEDNKDAGNQERRIAASADKVLRYARRFAA